MKTITYYFLSILLLLLKGNIGYGMELTKLPQKQKTCMVCFFLNRAKGSTVRMVEEVFPITSAGLSEIQCRVLDQQNLKKYNIQAQRDLKSSHKDLKSSFTKVRRKFNASEGC